MNKLLKNTALSLTLGLISVQGFSQPRTEFYYTLSGKYYMGFSLDSSSTLSGVYGDNTNTDFNFVDSPDSLFNLLVIKGNIRLDSRVVLSENGKIFIMPNSIPIFQDIVASNGDTVHNYGHLTINTFKAYDTLVIINHPGASLTCYDVNRPVSMQNGSTLAGNCKTGVVLCLTSEEGANGLPTTGIMNHTTSKPKNEPYRLYDLSGRLVDKGVNYSRLDKSNLPSAIYILVKGQGNNIQSEKIYLGKL